MTGNWGRWTDLSKSAGAVLAVTLGSLALGPGRGGRVPDRPHVDGQSGEVRQRHSRDDRLQRGDHRPPGRRDPAGDRPLAGEWAPLRPGEYQPHLHDQHHDRGRDRRRRHAVRPGP